MYSTCVFCHSPLGGNNALENFPVGRRIAFDPSRGRLWVVCRSCERWNLSPIEERWEVLEACEREYRNSRLRASTEQIGLARLHEGLELVRIGRPHRPEFAAWRYGDQFGRRRRNMLLKTGAGLAGIGVVAAGASIAGASLGVFAILGGQVTRAVRGNPNEVIATLPSAAEPLAIRRFQLASVKLVERSGSWGLLVPNPNYGSDKLRDRMHDASGYTNLLKGAEAETALRLLLPAVNRFGGSGRRVREAVQLMESGDPATFIGRTAAERGQHNSPPLSDIPYSVRLALEMASHEDVERRALEGELEILEAAWRNAEEVARIADDMFLSQSLLDRLRSLGARRG